MPLEKAVNIEDLRRLAKRRLPRAIFDFFDGGAEDEVTLRENRAAFERVRLLPRVLVDVSKVRTAVDLLGKPSSMPLAIAPTGGISAGRYGAELILARAAKAAGVPFTMATPSAFSIERVAEEVGGRLWFQLYAVRNREFRDKLVERAKGILMRRLGLSEPEAFRRIQKTSMDTRRPMADVAQALLLTEEVGHSRPAKP